VRGHVTPFGHVIDERRAPSKGLSALVVAKIDLAGYRVAFCRH